ncbi:MAG TPA: 50S ribosomal protein L4, partial [Candidatus Saccharimonadales bacterium]
MAVKTFSKSGQSGVAAKLDKAVFSVDVNDHSLLKQAYLAESANRRQQLAFTKTRGEIRGGGRKPWRQKGTGRARFGSIRNPIWRGGGIVFGPRHNNFSKRLSRSARNRALVQALTL